MRYSIKMFFAGLSALFAASLGAAPKDGGGIVFIGDSITQGGNYLAGTVPSYRYQLFKNFVDNGIAYSPMGMTDGARHGVNVEHLTPEYRGKKFVNVSEAAASGRAYQYSGHPATSGDVWGKNRFKADPGSVAAVANRGPVTLKLGLQNPHTKDKKTYFDDSKSVTYAGETYRSRYGSKLPETLCILIGINDVYDSGSPDTVKATAGWVKEIVEAYQKANPEIEVHVFKLLPAGKNNGTGARNGYRYKMYNDYLEALNIEKTWSTRTSKVFLDDISTGFYAKDGAMCDTAGGAHPNAQGELIVAGNIARALGIGQRNCGFEEARIPAKKLETRVVFTDAGASAQTRSGNSREFKSCGKGSGIKSQNGTLVFDEKKERGDKTLELKWLPSAASRELREFVAVFKVKMLAAGGNDSAEQTVKNRFSIFFGNGKDQVGMLGIGENGIYWNGNKLLYGSNMDLYERETLEDLVSGKTASADPMAGYFTKKNHVFRVIYKQDKGYFVWLNGQLIGENLAGSKDAAVVNAHKDKLLFGDVSGETSCRAEISGAAFTVR